MLDDPWTVRLWALRSGLAILVELLNPVSRSMISANAEADLQPFAAANHDELLETVTKSTQAAVEIAGLAPTLVASITSGFAIIHEYPQPFWPAIGYVLIFIGLVLFILWMLSGNTLFEIDDLAFTVKFFRWEISMPVRTQVVRRIIYISNTLLIILAFGSYWHLNYGASSDHH
jgi:hypothetical protein